MIQASPNIDFNVIQDYLDNLFAEDEKAQNIIAKAGFTDMQLGIINTLIVGALKVYHLNLFPPTINFPPEIR